MAKAPRRRAHPQERRSRTSEVVRKEDAPKTSAPTSDPEPDETTGVRPRLDYDALGGTSESEARWASGAPEFEANPSDELEPGVIIPPDAMRAPDGSPTEEELSIEPDDLGRRFLEGATQDLKPTEANPADELRSLDEPFADEVEGTHPLLTRYPDRSEIEQAISEKARELQARDAAGEEEEPSPEDHVTALDRDPRYEHDERPSRRRKPSSRGSE